ncbi:MAG: hypothetical protein PHU07_05415, partial [Acidocella sp.]|nr:hypothetical protein [Acidocella sp.]
PHTAFSMNQAARKKQTGTPSACSTSPGWFSRLGCAAWAPMVERLTIFGGFAAVIGGGQRGGTANMTGNSRNGIYGLSPSGMAAGGPGGRVMAASAREAACVYGVPCRGA